MSELRRELLDCEGTLTTEVRGLLVTLVGNANNSNDD